MELKNLLAEKILMRPVGTGRKGYNVAEVKGKPLNILKGSQLLAKKNSATPLKTMTCNADETVEFTVKIKKSKRLRAV